VYVIGTEVPVPGGAAEDLNALQVTSVQAAQETLAIHEAAFAASQLQGAWERVIALVVQPGVEFDHTHVIDYRPEKAVDLSNFQRRQSKIVFEAHSTDYQRAEILERLVQDGFSILKVGPALTYALREALYALEMIEKELVKEGERSNLRDVVDAEMVEHPRDWIRYYSGDAEFLGRMRVYSYSDRVRYYWGRPGIVSAVNRLIENLQGISIPENMVGQFLPGRYHAYRRGESALDANSLLLGHVREAIQPYAGACLTSW
jgi:D-tagatose-1,6-bisphosphate aldolase subunit GatZ/KbaZ